MYQNRRFFIRYLIGLLLFGFNGIVASHIALESSQIVLLRTLLGSVSLLALFFLSGHRFSFTGRGRDVTLVLLSGAAMGASWMFLYAGYQTIGVSTASLLYYCCPVIVMALSPLVFHEALTWVKITGFVCVCGGIVLVNGWGGGSLSISGFLYGILSAVCYAAMLIHQQEGGKRGRHGEFSAANAVGHRHGVCASAVSRRTVHDHHRSKLAVDLTAGHCKHRLRLLVLLLRHRLAAGADGGGVRLSGAAERRHLLGAAAA